MTTGSVSIYFRLFLLFTYTHLLNAAFQSGDVFVASPQGVFRYSPSGVLLQTIKNGGPNTGMAFDAAGNLYVTNYSSAKISKFDNNGVLVDANFGGSFPDFPESVVIDKAGNVYVGMGANPKLVKLSPSGAKLAEWSPDPDWRGVNWIDLAADQKTIYYTSYGNIIKRFDVSSGTQLADFVQLTMSDSSSFALHIMSNGGLLVTHSSDVLLLTSSGNVAQTYVPPTDQSSFYALCADPNEGGFWVGESEASTVYHFNTSSGSLLSSFSDSFTFSRVTGLAVFGGITTPTTGTISVTANLDRATFSLKGPSSYTGSGKSWTQLKVPPGAYTISYGDVAGYTTPSSETKTVTAGGTISFNANYQNAGGSITVSSNIASATFSISGPASYNASGASWSQSNAPAGSYTITYGDVAGYSTPPAETKTLLDGGSLSFTGTYGSQGGTISVVTNLANASFTLTGPASYSGTGMSWSQAKAPAGAYTITYADVSGYITPSPEMKTLASAGAITFTATYASASTTGTMSVKANVAGATFSFTGPAAYSGSGTSWSQSNVPAGSYTVTYGALNGYTTPPSETKVLAAGGSLSFIANYVPVTANSGSIAVAANLAAATFSLTGAASFNGSGTAWSLSNAPPGSYMITYGDVPGYTTPSAEMKTLANSGAITFNATYVALGGSITVSTNLAGSSFSLSGASSYSGSGTSWSQLKAAAGVYTITYNDVPGYTTPAGETKTLSNGGSIAFTGNYVQVSSTGGTITVSTNRAAASFTLSGPANYSGSGASWSQAGAPAGTYTITYGDLSGYTTPAGRTLTLAAGGTITFSGIYVAVPTTGTIAVTTNLDAASFSVSGGSSYSGSGKSWTATDALPGTYTIVYGEVFGYSKPANATLALTAGGTVTFQGSYTAKPAMLTVTPQTLSFGAWLGAPSPAPKSLAVTCSTSCSMDFSAAVASGVQWLTVSGSGTTPGTVTVTANPASLGEGTYMGTITITAANATNSPLSIPVTFVVQPRQPLTISPTTFTFTYEMGKAAPAAQNLYLTVPLGQTPPVTASAQNSTWLLANPQTTSVPATIAVSVNPAGLQPGIYDDILRLVPGTGFLESSVRVRLTVIEAATLILTPSTLSFAYQKGGPAPSPQVVLVTSKGKPVNVIPKPNADWLMVNGGGTTTPLNFSIIVNPAALAPGVYSSSVSFMSPDIASDPIQLQVKLTIPSLAPSFQAGGVVNAASGSDQIAPCSIISIYGAAFAKTEIRASSLPIPLVLGESRVKVSGKALPLFYVSPGQINAQLSCDQPPGVTSLEVSNGSGSSSVSVTIAATGPGVFLSNGTWAAAQNQDLKTNGKDNPARPGSIVTVYFTGQGQLEQPIATGDPAPPDQLLWCRKMTSVSVGAQAAEVDFVGLTPGSVGLAQVNIRIPDLSAGDYPLLLKIGGVESNISRISVAASSLP